MWVKYFRAKYDSILHNNLSKINQSCIVQESATACRKRPSQPQNSYSMEFFTNNEPNPAESGEMMDSRQIRPSTTLDYCYPSEDPPPGSPNTSPPVMDQLNQRSASPLPSEMSPTKSEHCNSNRFHMDSSSMRRSSRLTQAQVAQQQQQQQFAAPQKVSWFRVILPPCIHTI